MTYVKWKIDYVPFEGGTWNESKRETLVGYRDVMLRRFLGESKDSFEFKLTNTNGEYDYKFNVNDKIYIYKAVNTETIPTDPEMVGTVRDGTFSDNYSKDVITVKGYNFSESVMNSTVFIDARNLKINEALQQALLNMSAFNSNFTVTWDSTNPTTLSNGNDFPLVNEKFYYKPIRKLIEDYSTKSATGDVYNYYYYVDKDNKLVWKRGNQYGINTFDTSTDSYRSEKIGKDLNGIINFVIIKGGLDPKGHPIQTPYVNQKSISKVGYKFKVIVSQTISAQTLVDEDMSNTYTKDEKQATINTYPKEIEAGTSFTTVWKSRTKQAYTLTTSGITVNPNSTVTINEGTAAANKSAYVELIRAETKLRLKQEAERITEDLQYGKLKFDVEFQPGEKTWGLGDRVNVTNPKIKKGETTQLRIIEIQDSTNSTQYSMEEDIGTVGN